MIGERWIPYRLLSPEKRMLRDIYAQMQGKEPGPEAYESNRFRNLAGSMLAGNNSLVNLELSLRGAEAYWRYLKDLYEAKGHDLNEFMSYRHHWVSLLARAWAAHQGSRAAMDILERDLVLFEMLASNWGWGPAGMRSTSRNIKLVENDFSTYLMGTLLGAGPVPPKGWTKRNRMFVEMVENLRVPLRVTNIRDSLGDPGTQEYIRRTLDKLRMPQSWEMYRHIPTGETWSCIQGTLRGGGMKAIWAVHLSEEKVAWCDPWLDGGRIRDHHYMDGCRVETTYRVGITGTTVRDSIPVPLWLRNRLTLKGGDIVGISVWGDTYPSLYFP